MFVGTQVPFFSFFKFFLTGKVGGVHYIAETVSTKAPIRGNGDEGKLCNVWRSCLFFFLFNLYFLFKKSYKMSLYSTTCPAYSWTTFHFFSHTLRVTNVINICFDARMFYVLNYGLNSTFLISACRQRKPSNMNSVAKKETTTVQLDSLPPQKE